MAFESLRGLESGKPSPQATDSSNDRAAFILARALLLCQFHYKEENFMLRFLRRIGEWLMERGWEPEELIFGTPNVIVAPNGLYWYGD